MLDSLASLLLNCIITTVGMSKVMAYFGAALSNKYRPITTVDDGKLELQHDTRQPKNARMGMIGGYRLIAAIFGATVGSLVSWRYDASSSSPTTHRFIPQQVFSPAIPRIFAPDDRYIGWSTFADSNWRRLIAPTEAVYLSESETTGMLDGFAQPGGSSASHNETNFFRISNAHQLHCVNILRLRLRSYDNAAAYPDEVPSLSVDDAANAREHSKHCIEYLRQTIMCGLTLAIETNSPPGTPQELVNDPWGNPLGWGTRHECINWEALTTWQYDQLEKWKHLE